jgi:small subunit ribosomal protein S16
VAVRIRMKQLGRRHRPFYRICAMDSRTPRNGRVLEELGTYDPMVPETDARAILKSDRIKFWISKGALPSDKVNILIKKYAEGGTHVEAQRTAIARLSEMRRRKIPLHAPTAPAAAATPAAEEAAEASE